MRNRIISLLIVPILLTLSAGAETISPGIKPAQKLWTGNRLTPEQPFGAKVIAVSPSWVGYYLLLQEYDGHRLCIVRIFATAPITYTAIDDTKGETLQSVLGTEADKLAWTYLTPGVDVDWFSWSMGVGIYKIGKIFGDEDLVLQAQKFTRANEIKATQDVPAP